MHLDRSSSAVRAIAGAAEGDGVFGEEMAAMVAETLEIAAIVAADCRPIFIGSKLFSSEDYERENGEFEEYVNLNECYRRI